MSPRTVRREMTGRVVIALPLLALLPAFVIACGGAGVQTERPPQVVVRDTALLSPDAARLAAFRIAPAESLAWRESWSAPARLTLDPSETQSLGAIAEGRVTRVLARVGDSVREADVLVAIHSHEMMDALSTLAKAAAADARAAAECTLAESAALRAERLYQLKALSLAELERARTELAQASSARRQSQAELTRARAAQSHLVGTGRVPPGTDEHEVLVRSPIDGLVVGLDARPGAVVLVGAPLVVVSRTTSLVLQMHLPERALAAVDPGATVRFTVSAFPGERFEARVTRVAPTLDSATRTLAVQAAVQGAADRLRAEMYASAELLGAPNVKVLTVAAEAVQAFAGDTVVITARPRDDGVELEAVRVRVGRRTAERAEILDGLAAGTPVVSGGAAVAKAELLRRRGGA
jgi:cobalt-zinc-cadmium efflux system membrane fusion protein